MFRRHVFFQMIRRPSPAQVQSCFTMCTLVAQALHEQRIRTRSVLFKIQNSRSWQGDISKRRWAGKMPRQRTPPPRSSSSSRQRAHVLRHRLQVSRRNRDSQIRPNRNRPNSAELGQHRPGVGQSCPSSTQFGPSSTEHGPRSAEVSTKSGTSLGCVPRGVGEHESCVMVFATPGPAGVGLRLPREK